tara:strand:- start:6920 stop:7489 length:570 start_codon:yes stop_codon:yes gene_type:complete
MKKFKELANSLNLHEMEYTEGGALGGTPSAPGGANSIHSDEGVHRIEKDSQKKRVSAFLNAFSRKEYLDPKAALSILRSKLNIIGLDFDFNPAKNDCEMAMRTGEPMVYRMTRFGGVFGTSPDHDLLKNGFINSDGISDARGGVGLNLTINLEETPNGLHRLDLSIDDATEEMEEEETDSEEVTPEEEE